MDDMELEAAPDLAPGFMGRQASGIGRRLAVAVALVAVVLGIFSGPAESDGAIIFAADQPASLTLGAQMALTDKVRQVQFDIVGGSYLQLHGTATPLAAC